MVLSIHGLDADEMAQLVRMIPCKRLPTPSCSSCNRAWTPLLLTASCSGMQVLDEIRPQLVELAQNPYAHFLVSKLLAKATRADAVGERCCSILLAFLNGFACWRVLLFS